MKREPSIKVFGFTTQKDTKSKERLHMSNETIEIKMDEFLNEFDLTHGNAEVIVGAKDITMSIEAPQHTVISLYFNQKDIERLEEDFDNTVKQKVAEAVGNFDVDEEFDELWSPAFRDHNNFRASQFIRLLESDKRFFNDVVQSLSAKQQA